MKKLIQLTLCLGLLALASCKEKKPATSETETQQEKLEHWQIRAEREAEARFAAESDKLSSVSRAQTLEKAVIATGVAAVIFLFIGGAMGSKAKKDVLNS
ncbi:hypothetical protein N9Z02_00360 [Akkermansiaceae bacterium]|nr:hypothetical protein [Akkermansiaceae bacterium]